MRVALGLIMQETHSFSPLSTRIEDFRTSALVPFATGLEMIDTHRHAESEVGGFIKACEEGGVEMVPLMATYAMTSGPLTAETFEWLRSSLLDLLQNAGPLDAVLIAQHGSMASEGVDDPEGEILSSIKALLPGIPVGCSLDVHGVLTQKMVDNSEILVCYETHRDYRDIGERTAKLLLRCMREGIKPVHYLRKLPLVLGRSHLLLDDKRSVENDDDEILTISVMACNPWTDVAEFGPTVLLTATHEDVRFEEIRDRFAHQLWDARIDPLTPSVPMEEAIGRVLENESGRGPVILQDWCDIVGGGGIGDDVTTITALLTAGADNVAAIIYDPETVERAFEQGEGARGMLSIGGKIGEEIAPPLHFDGTVTKLFDGDYEHVGPPYGGLRVPLGPTARISAGEVDIVLTSKRIYPQPFSLLKTMGIDPAAKQGINCKDVCDAHNIAGAEVMNVTTPGITTWDFTKLPFRRAERPRFPMDDIADPF